MVICPIAIAVTCNKCPIVSVCPLKGSIGNYKLEPPPIKAAAPKSKVTTRSKRARTRRSRKR
jgi:hypothetical protein